MTTEEYQKTVLDLLTQITGAALANKDEVYKKIRDKENEVALLELEARRLQAEKTIKTVQEG